MWLPYSFLSTFFDSLQNLYYKKTALQINPILMAWSVLVISGICYVPLLFLGIPHLDQTFWIAVLLRLVIDSIAFTLFITGVQKSPLSLTIPMMSLVPIFSVVTVFFINHLLPSPLGLVGIMATVIGLYLLHFDHDTKHLLSPFRAVLRERGVLYVAIASVMWSVVAGLQRLGMDHSSVSFYTAFFQIFWAICFTPVAFFADRKSFLAILRPRSVALLVPAGVIDAIKMLFQNLAYSLTIPAYVSSVGNTGMLISAVFGAVFFKEKIKHHLLPILIILFGITLIVWGQR